MMGWIIAGIFGVLLIALFGLWSTILTRKASLDAFAIMLLLHDEMRELGKSTFLKWLQSNTDTRSRGELYQRSRLFLERIITARRNAPGGGEAEVRNLVWMHREGYEDDAL